MLTVAYTSSSWIVLHDIVFLAQVACVKIDFLWCSASSCRCGSHLMVSMPVHGYLQFLYSILFASDAQTVAMIGHPILLLGHQQPMCRVCCTHSYYVRVCPRCRHYFCWPALRYLQPDSVGHCGVRCIGFGWVCLWCTLDTPLDDLFPDDNPI